MSTCTRKRWDFFLPTSTTGDGGGSLALGADTDGEHSVYLIHDIITGKFVLRLDNDIVFERKRKLWDTGGKFGPFTVQGPGVVGKHDVTVTAKDSLAHGFKVRAC